MTTVVRICVAVLLAAFSFRAAAEDFTDAIRAFLQRRVDVEKWDVGIVIATVDEHGSNVISYGKAGDGTGREVDGDTLFEIGSITKTFTALLLQDMVERGEMKLNDPLSKYLPGSVRVPTRNGKEITLLQLATHTSGFPQMSITWMPDRAETPHAEYSIDRLYDFVSGFTLTRDPGTKYEYSTVGTALLGQAIALKTGTNYESLVVDRICRPLGMESTRITLTPALNVRLAIGHNYCGYAVTNSYWGALMPGAALRSTANDLLKYVSAQLGFSESSLTPLIKRTHVSRFHAHMDTDLGEDADMGLGWMITRASHGESILQHGGMTEGFVTFVGFDLKQRHGVVVLSNSQDFDMPRVSKLLLESEWQSDRRPTAAKISGDNYDSCVGEYRRHGISPDSAPVLRVRREGNRLFAQATESESWMLDVLLPHAVVELMPESETRFFERLSGRRITFSRDAHGKVAGLTIQYRRHELTYDKISDQPPAFYEQVEPRVAIQLDPKLLDACVGQYQFATSAAFPDGAKLTIWREGGQLVGKASGQKTIQGAFNIYPESKTNFFIKINGARLTFIKNDVGQVTAVIQHSYRAKFPDCEGKKLSSD